MPARVPMTERQREALLPLPDTEDEVVRHHSLDADDLAAIAEARTPETHPKLRPPALLPAISRPQPQARRGAARSHARSHRRAIRRGRGAPTPPRASSCCRADGSASGPSAGSVDAAASPRTSRPRSRAPSPGSWSPTSDASRVGSSGRRTSRAITSQTLREARGL
jgi:hypothetical protein